MSLIYLDINNEFGTSAIWNIMEESEFFVRHLGCSAPEKINTKKLRKMEWLASRYLANKIDDISVDNIIKDKFGKPHLKNSRYCISLSHSGTFAAYASHQYSIGIDIQIYKSNIEKISPKFTSQEEINLLPDSYSYDNRWHIIWTIKEAVFKLYGKKELPFKHGIQLHKSILDGSKLYSEGIIALKNKELPFRSKTEVENNFCITKAIYLHQS